MENRSFYNEILTGHNLHPEFKHDLPDADIVLEGVNPSCGDDIFLKLKLDGDVIADGAFVGDGCAISQASADIMLGMIVGKKKADALKRGGNLSENDSGRSIGGGDRQSGRGFRAARYRAYASTRQMRSAGLADAERDAEMRRRAAVTAHGVWAEIPHGFTK